MKNKILSVFIALSLIMSGYAFNAQIINAVEGDILRALVVSAGSHHSSMLSDGLHAIITTDNKYTK